MNGYQRANPFETLPARPVSSPTPAAPVAGNSDSTVLRASPTAASPDCPPSVTTAKGARRPKGRRRLSSRRIRWIAAAVAMGQVIGLSVGLATATSASAAQLGSGSNARSGPAPGGSSGTVASVSKSSFTLTTSAGQKVTIEEGSSTKYEKGTTSSSKSAVAKGKRVLVLGTVSSTTIKATEVIVQTDGGSAATTAAAVVPFQRGAPKTSKQIGQIPASYSQGSGTIVSGTTANKATEAALAAYPGGIVDRVVKLSNGEYEVHYIGVNWPHHIFVNQDDKVVGAE
jgi:Domain of unknown function (DUF5666)